MIRVLGRLTVELDDGRELDLAATYGDTAASERNLERAAADLAAAGSDVGLLLPAASPTPAS